MASCLGSEGARVLFNRVNLWPLARLQIATLFRYAFVARQRSMPERTGLVNEGSPRNSSLTMRLHLAKELCGCFFFSCQNAADTQRYLGPFRVCHPVSLSLPPAISFSGLVLPSTMSFSRFGNQHVFFFKRVGFAAQNFRFGFRFFSRSFFGAYGFPSSISF